MYKETNQRRTAPAAAREDTTVNWEKIMAAVVAALEGYPEARAAVVRALEEE